jgi:hypothetical protein
MPADGYHRVFEGREIPGNLESPAIYTYQCWTCLSVWRTEAEAAGCVDSHKISAYQEALLEEYPQGIV